MVTLDKENTRHILNNIKCVEKIIKKLNTNIRVLEPINMKDFEEIEDCVKEIIKEVKTEVKKNKKKRFKKKLEFLPYECF
jgi:hypothetical protein